MPPSSASRSMIPYANGAELPPGTFYLIDRAGTSDAKHDRRHADIVLVPTPSKDVNDPLNWSPSRKLTQLVGLIVYTLVVGFCSASIYSALVPISEQTGITVAQLNHGTGYMFLMFGWGCLFWQALAVAFGKRPIYLLSILLTLAVQLWGAYINTNSMWIVNKMLQGFVGAPIESLVEVSVSDLYFSHERGTYIGVYVLCLFMSSFLAPVFAGLMNANQGWEWVLKWGAIVSAAGFVICFFTLEETNYVRQDAADLQKPLPPAFSHTPSFDDKESGKTDADVVVTALILEDCTLVDKTVLRTHTMRTHTMRQRYFSLPKPVPHAWSLFAKHFYTPVLLLSVPIIFFCGFQYGINLVYYNILNATASSILAASPYRFNSVATGLAYLSPSAGCVISTMGVGYVADKVKICMARRNQGFSEPEHRLWLFPAGFVLAPLALVCWGVGASYHLSWPFLVIMGMGVLATAVGLGTSLALNYAIDCYKDLEPSLAKGTSKTEAGPHFEALPCVMTSVILVRNTMSFAIGYGINPWIEGVGERDCFITIAAIAAAASLSWYAFIRYGKRLRVAGKDRYMRLVS